jgi:tetratricopeptide (TPR) repeat protein
LNAAANLRLRRAGAQLARGQVDAAIETLAMLLGDEPDDADAHALLALCLARRKRLHAARMEAETSLQLDPENVFAHRAMALVLSFSRRFQEALKHLQAAQALAPDDALVEIDLAGLHLAWQHVDAALPHAQRARELLPDSEEPLVMLARVAAEGGRRDQAEALAREALEIDPESVDALVIVGDAALAAGRVDDAREHAAWALQQDPEHAGALELICSIKARQSPWIGLWWRFQAFVTSGGGTRAVAILLGIFLSYKTGAIVLEEYGRPDAAQLLRYVWLGFCVYTWVAPEVFLRALRRELQQVRLRPDF